MALYQKTNTVDPAIFCRIVFSEILIGIYLKHVARNEAFALNSIRNKKNDDVLGGRFRT